MNVRSASPDAYFLIFTGVNFLIFGVFLRMDLPEANTLLLPDPSPAADSQSKQAQIAQVCLLRLFIIQKYFIETSCSMRTQNPIVNSSPPAKEAAMRKNWKTT